MELQVFSIPLVIILLVVCCNGIEGRTISNSSTVKTILTVHGDTYDCVDFYKQPAFGHPMLKNRTFDYYKLLAAPVPDATFKDSLNANYLASDELEGEKCPIGTVPIMRVTKVGLPREKVVNGGGVYIAGARIKTTGRYSGARAYISTHSLNITGNQYSAARVKIQNGPDSIEAGWRVDPTLYGDSKTRHYIRTTTGSTSCFNTLCGGFVLLKPQTYLGRAFKRTTPPRDGPYMELPVSIIRDKQGNWNLYFGPKMVNIGFWPSKIFTGLKDVASYIEWAGEVYDPINPKPIVPMGAGNTINDKIAVFRQTSEYVETDNQPIDANDLEAFSDSDFYLSGERFNKNPSIRHEILYGGPK